MDSMQNPYTDLNINSHAQLSILEAVRKYNPGVKIIFASTSQIYRRHARRAGSFPESTGHWYSRSLS
jgi:GDP-D-mannose dehydratase